MNKITTLLMIAFLSANITWAQTTNRSEEAELSAFDVMPARGGMLSNVVIDSQVTTAKAGSYTRVNMHLSCYATNLRGVANPVSENSWVVAFVDVHDNSGARRTIQVEFPAELLKALGARGTTSWNGSVEDMVSVSDPNARIKANGNVLQLLLPNLKEMTITSEGEVTNVTEKNMIFAGIRFIQRAPPGGRLIGSYFGSAGPLSSRLNWYTSIDGKTIDVYADFPGAASPGMRARYQGETRTGFCGAYYSPLMLFFDDELPAFTGKSAFPIRENQSGGVYWPEPYAPGYFLALDEKNNSEIKNGSQLFGDYGNYENGFENLKVHDSNGDGVIDAKDKVFSKLKLWNDENGDGVSQKAEVKTLKEKGVISIELKYENVTSKFGNRAQYKQKSVFKFKEKSKVKKGTVLDIWFSPTSLPTPSEKSK